MYPPLRPLEVREPLLHGLNHHDAVPKNPAPGVMNPKKKKADDSVDASNMRKSWKTVKQREDYAKEQERIYRTSHPVSPVPATPPVIYGGRGMGSSPPIALSRD